MTPEQRLMGAVLEDAVRLLRDPATGGRRGLRPRAEAEAWLMSDDTSWPFSFLNVCSALSIVAASVRACVPTRHSAAA